MNGAPQGQDSGDVDPAGRPVGRLSGLLSRLMPDGLRPTLVLLVLVVTVPLLVVEASTSYWQFTSQRSMLLQANLELARSVASNFDTSLRDLLHQEMLLGALAGPANPNDQAARGRLELLRTENPIVRSVTWLDARCQVAASTDPSGDRQGAEQACALAAGSSQGWAVTDLNLNRSDNRVSFYASRTIFGADGSRYGVMVAEADPERLDQVLGASRDQGSSILILDSRGFMVYRHPAASIPWEQRDFSNVWPGNARARAGEEVTGTLTSAIDGSQRLAAVTPIRSIGWVASATESESEALAPLTQGLVEQSGLVLVVLFASLLAAGSVASGIARPIRTLQSHAVSIGQGQMENGVEVSRPRELRDLASAFNRMTNELRERQSQLTEANSALSVQSEESRRLAEEAQQAHRLLRIAVSTMPVGVIMCDAHGNYTITNEAARSVLGLVASNAFEPFAGSTIHLVDGSPLPADALPIVLAMRDGEFIQDMELLVRREDGKELVILASASPVRNETGDITGAVSILVDITGRKRAEEALRDSEERYRSVVEAMGDGVHVKDVNLRYIMVNSEHLRRLGRSVDEVIGKTAGDMYDPALATRITAEDMHVLRTGETIETEEVFPNPVTGVTVLVRKAPIRDSTGRIVGLVTVSRDITERKRAEEEVRLRATELDLTIGSIADGVMILDTKGRIVRMNPAAESILGRTLVKQRLPRLEESVLVSATGPNGHPLPVSEMPAHRALRGQIVVGQSMVVKARDGRLVWISASAAPIRTDIGELLGAVVTFSDVTVQHQMHQQQEEIIHTVSHDLRAPLTVIMGHAGILARMQAKSIDSSRLLYGVQAIEHASKQMNAMIQDLVDSTRLETGNLALDRIPIKPVTFLQELMERLKGILEVDRIQLETAGEVAPVLADPARLERIVMNLLTNAFKYSEPGTMISVTMKHTGHEIVFTVSDQGEGIPREQLPKLFDRYGVSTETRKKRDSLGLGLYITKGLVEAHDGRIG